VRPIGPARGCWWLVQLLRERPLARVAALSARSVSSGVGGAAERASHDRRKAPARRWYRPAHASLPPEPGRLVVSALLGRARRARGCSTPGDDRLETRAYAVKRYLFRLGHAQRSAGTRRRSSNSSWGWRR
jgi:hypothetical protein